MNLLTLKTSLDNSVWAMSPPAFLTFKANLEAAIKNGIPDAYTVTPGAEDEDPMGDVVFLPVCGHLVKGTGLTEAVCDVFGICDLDYLEEDLREARDNPAINQIVLGFASPGGTVHAHSTALLIAEIAKTKNVIGYCDSEACSAAYQLAAMCNKFYVSETALVGFVGTIFTRPDYTEGNKLEGVKYTFVTSSPKKLYLNPNASITAEEQAWIEETVMYLYGIFKADVQSNRNIKDELLDARILIGEQAVESNFADGIVHSLDELVKNNLNEGL